MSVIVVSCPDGHKFPVNLKKHEDRRIRYCPHPGCMNPVAVRPRFHFIGNPNWFEQKEMQRQNQRMLRQMRKSKAQRDQDRDLIRLVGGLGRIPLEYIAAVQRSLSQKKKEEATKNDNKSV